MQSIDSLTFDDPTDLIVAVNRLADAQTRIAKQRLNFQNGYNKAKKDLVQRLQAELKKHPDVLDRIIGIVSTPGGQGMNDLLVEIAGRPTAERRESDMRKARAESDFQYFCNTYLSHYFTKAPAPYQLAIYKVITEGRVDAEAAMELRRWTREPVPQVRARHRGSARHHRHGTTRSMVSLCA